MTVPSYVRVSIGGLVRSLPVREVKPGFHIALLSVTTDVFLARVAGEALARLMPEDAEVLVMPEGKAGALLHTVQYYSDLEGVVASKEVRTYMEHPIVSVECTSATSPRVHRFHVDAEGARKIRGSNVVVLDDVVSGRGTADAVAELCWTCGSSSVRLMAIATEGVRHPDVISLTHLETYES